MATLAVQVDLLNNGSFVDAGDDVTARVLGRTPLRFQRGHSLVAGLMPPESGACTLELDNRSGDYSPGSNLKRGRRVRAQITDGTTYTLWQGVVNIPRQNRHSTLPSVVVTAFGKLGRLRRRSQRTSALYQTIRIDDAMRVVFTDAGLIEGTDYILDAYQTTLDWWWYQRDEDFFDIAVKLHLSEGPGARLYEASDGRITGKCRWADSLDARSNTSQATLYESGTEPTFQQPVTETDPEKNIINQVSLNYELRSLDALSVVWTLGSTLTLVPLEVRIFVASATNPFVGALVPAAGTDYTLVSGMVTLALDRTSGTEVTLTMTAGPAGATVTGLKMRAQPLTVKATYALKNSVDATQSINDNGPKPYTLNLYPWINPNVLQGYADALVSLNKNGRSIVPLFVNSGAAARLAQQGSREVGDQITLNAPTSGLGDKYNIERIEHEIGPGVVLRTMLGLRRRTATRYAQFDISTSDGPDVLAI